MYADVRCLQMHMQGKDLPITRLCWTRQGTSRHLHLPHSQESNNQVCTVARVIERLLISSSGHSLFPSATATGPILSTCRIHSGSAIHGRPASFAPHRERIYSSTSTTAGVETVI